MRQGEDRDQAGDHNRAAGVRCAAEDHQRFAGAAHRLPGTGRLRGRCGELGVGHLRSE